MRASYLSALRIRISDSLSSKVKCGLRVKDLRNIHTSLCLNESIKSPTEIPKLSSIESYLALKKVEGTTNSYTNVSELYVPYRGRGLFGGTLAAQSVLASLLSANTETKKWKPISLHCHFLVAAQPTSPLIYQVDDLKHGKNYSTKQITLFQNNELIFKATCNLQAYHLEGSAGKLEGQLNHHRKGPIIGETIKPWDEMLDQEEVFKVWAAKTKTHHHQSNTGYLGKELEKVIASYNREPCLWRLPIDMFDPESISQQEKDMLPSERTLRYWVKTKERIIDQDIFRWVAIAYISDYFYLSVNMRLNLREMFTTKFSVSLDHTIYFNHEIDPCDWVSYNIKSLKSGENRSLMFGEMFSQDGKLAATTIQEGLSVIHASK
ncbi:hypothetical protein CANARDRAFT_27823 [[Candida] arabinofermentans NRRL YB-2248]|uniref:Acyl-CoA thioesterase II n=1 Tax=[Candida] arabinofermentans NRRL YB-2248 TaxID=983967 RepID=A0A1E4T1W1_9ASCO|nr:hypothetical protein CANARDRAFT_27823 [[Candida] arabinofermentans NRRL YB-2248]